MLSDNQASCIALTLDENGRFVSGAVTFGDNEPARIRHAEMAGNILGFILHDAPGSVVKFRLKAVNGLLVGQFLHRGKPFRARPSLATASPKSCCHSITSVPRLRSCSRVFRPSTAGRRGAPSARAAEASERGGQLVRASTDRKSTRLNS